MNRQVKSLGTAIFLLVTSASAYADTLKFKPGFYVPTELANTCKTANFASFDWVLNFHNRGRGGFNDSEGRCEFKKVSNASRQSFEVDMTCIAQDEAYSQRMLIEVDRKTQKITALDGQPYSFCTASN